MKDDNELIAEFMGMVRLDESDNLLDPDKLFKDASGKYWSIENELIKYQTSWDWLMPVVFKIDKLYNDNFPPDFIQRVILKESDIIDNHYMNVIGVPLSTPIEEVYKAIVEFIKWYNTK